jgi:hypothetical protein
MDGWMGGWMDGWMGGKAGLRIAYSNQKELLPLTTFTANNIININNYN